LQHGWGFDSTIWHPWLSVLEPQHEVLNLDRGYFGRKFSPLVNASQNAAPARRTARTPTSKPIRIVVSHSFGLHLLTHETLRACNVLVIISGFARFISAGDTLLRRSYKQMKSRLITDHKALLQDFYSSCFQAHEQHRLVSEPTADLELLSTDLDRLGKSNLFEAEQLDAGPGDSSPPLAQSILILHGRNDTIVALAKAEELHERLPGSVLRVHNSANHALPFLEETWCMQQIDQYVTDREPFKASCDGSQNSCNNSANSERTEAAATS
jgi:pimeloyl-ACP methyl ester carboxylesterase